jgi:sterol desaturase/sphingolipid hydroxylase (fatty acid hydroxylase superfamily)
MFIEFLSVLEVAGQTLLKIVPVTIGLGVVFAVLTHWSACNPGRAWWNKREIVTDVCYWFLIPLAARFVRIGLMVMGAAMLFDIHGADALIKFYDNGFGPLAEMPLWAQAITFLVVSDFLLYWFHRWYHGAHLWKYHAVHHSSEELDWISAARFHPVNILFGTVLVDVALLLAGISPNVMLWVGPFTTASSAFVHANLNWSLASHRGRPRRLQQLRRHLPDLGYSVWHLVHAGARTARRLRHR